MFTNQGIHDQVMAHVNKEGSPYSSWYVGIASDPKQRLFSDHGVANENAWWIHREAASANDARAVEMFLIENYKFDGGPGGGDQATNHVYAYRKVSGKTNP